MDWPNTTRHVPHVGLLHPPGAAAVDVSSAIACRRSSTASARVNSHSSAAVHISRSLARNSWCTSCTTRIVGKRQRRSEGFDDKILALYSRGPSTRDVETHLEEIYGVKAGGELMTKVTDGVMDDARAWTTPRSRRVQGDRSPHSSDRSPILDGAIAYPTAGCTPRMTTATTSSTLAKCSSSVMPGWNPAPLPRWDVQPDRRLRTPRVRRPQSSSAQIGCVSNRTPATTTAIRSTGIRSMAPKVDPRR